MSAEVNKRMATNGGDYDAAFAYADRSRVKDEQPVSAAVMRDNVHQLVPL